MSGPATPGVTIMLMLVRRLDDALPYMDDTLPAPMRLATMRPGAGSRTSCLPKIDKKRVGRNGGKGREGYSKAGVRGEGLEGKGSGG